MQNKEKLPDYWGVWTEPRGIKGVFFMIIDRTEGLSIEGRLEDDVRGSAVFTGCFTQTENETRMTFDKRYVIEGRPTGRIIRYEGSVFQRMEGSFLFRRIKGTYAFHASVQDASDDVERRLSTFAARTASNRHGQEFTMETFTYSEPAIVIYEKMAAKNKRGRNYFR